MTKRKALPPPPTLIEKFTARYSPEPNTGCWLWTAKINCNGYGIISMGRHVGQKLAHRISYELFKEPIPDGLFVLHGCDVRSCVNPDHLRIGTAQENTNDMISRGRKIQLVGTDCDNSIMTEMGVRIAREANLAGFGHRKLAKYFGIGATAMRSILRGRKWRHVPMPTPVQ